MATREPVVDPLLRGFVYEVDHSKPGETERPSHTLTLLLGGALVTGTLLPEWQWVQEVAPDPHDLDDEVAARRRHPQFLEPEFLHLRDAIVQLTDGVRTEKAGHWRCRLSDIYGWSIKSDVHELMSAEPGRAV